MESVLFNQYDSVPGTGGFLIKPWKAYVINLGWKMLAKITLRDI